MNDQLVKNIETIVDEIFKKKEEAEMKKETEAALLQAAGTITQLTESLEAKDTEQESVVAEHQAAVAALQETITSLEAQLNEVVASKKVFEDEKAVFDKEKEELIKRAEAAEKELENIKKDQIARERMTVLQTAGVSSTNVEAQTTKVREMSEEEFASYKDELVSVKESIVKQLESTNSLDDASKKALATTNDVAAKEAEVAKILESRLAELKEAGAEVVDTADIEKIKSMDDAAFASFKEELIASLGSSNTDSIDPMRAAAAALNMEVKPNEDMISKYRALGAALADNINTRKKRQ